MDGWMGVLAVRQDALPVASPPVPPAAGGASSAVHSGSAAA